MTSIRKHVDFQICRHLARLEQCNLHISFCMHGLLDYTYMHTCIHFILKPVLYKVIAAQSSARLCYQSRAIKLCLFVYKKISTASAEGQPLSADCQNQKPIQVMYSQGESHQLTHQLMTRHLVLSLLNRFSLSRLTHSEISRVTHTEYIEVKRENYIY